MTWCIFLKKFVFNDDKCLCSYNIWSQQLKQVNFSLWMFRHSKPNNSNIWLNIKRAHVYFTQGPRFLCHFTVRGFKPKFMLHKHRTCIQIIKFRGSNIKWNPYIQLLETEHFTELCLLWLVFLLQLLNLTVLLCLCCSIFDDFDVFLTRWNLI